MPEPTPELREKITAEVEKYSEENDQGDEPDEPDWDAMREDRMEREYDEGRQITE